MTDQAGFCTTLIDVLAHESFGADAVVEGIRGFDGKSPWEGNQYCCVDATEAQSEFRGLITVDGDLYCFVAQINSNDQRRSRFIPASDVLEDPSGTPRKMQPLIQEMILGRKRGVMLIPETEADAVDVIAGLEEQGFTDLATQYRDFIMRQLEKSKAAAKPTA